MFIRILSLVEARHEELLERATIDCYDEEEEFSSLLCTLDEHLCFPLRAKILGIEVEMLGLDSIQSSLRRGFVAEVRGGNQLHTVGLFDLALLDSDPESAEWLAMARWWADYGAD
jgi:hypothetical protein